MNPHRNNGGKFGPADWNWEGIKKGTDTIPSLLRANGYRTIHVGKAHFGPLGSYAENPINIGFDVNVGGCAWGQPGSYYGEKNFVGDRGQNPVPNLERYFGKDIFLTDALTLEAKREIKKCADENRFFIYVPLRSPFAFSARQAIYRLMMQYKSSTSKDWLLLLP
ncbi:MAG: sulfatase-like hydrolase/transferase [Bacilli bacterium]